jgi:hypothetical protein
MGKLNTTRRIPRRSTFRTRDEAMAALQKAMKDNREPVKEKARPNGKGK